MVADSLVHFPVAFLPARKEELPFDRDCIRTDFVSLLRFEKAVFHRVLSVAAVENRIDCCREVAEARFDRVGDSWDGVRMRMDFGLDCGDRNIPVVVVLPDRMPRIASAAVVVAVLDSLWMPRMVASVVAVAADPIRVDTARMRTDLVVALVVDRRDLEMVHCYHHIVVGTSRLLFGRLDSERILRQQLPQRRRPMDFGAKHCRPRTEPKVLSMVVVLHRNECFRLEIDCEFVLLFERLWSFHHPIPPMLPTWKIEREADCWVTSCYWAY